MLLEETADSRAVDGVSFLFHKVIGCLKIMVTCQKGKEGTPVGPNWDNGNISVDNK